MKNLYIAILLLVFTGNLSAFDKVWELQFASTPHHVHYTEGHKELIVGEGNTFKKYNAETGVLLDSVVMNLDSLKLKILSYQIDDNLKNIYLLYEISEVYYLSKLDISQSVLQKLNFSLEKLINNGGAGGITINKLGIITKLNSNLYILPCTTSYPVGGLLASNGFMYVLKNDSITSIGSGSNIYIDINTFSQSFITVNRDYYPGLQGNTDRINDNSYLWNSGFTKSVDVKYGVISKFNKYRYTIFDNNKTNPGFISRDQFENKVLQRSIDKSYKRVYPFSNDDEILLQSQNKIFHYNFNLNYVVDSIIANNNNQYLTDLKNDYLVEISSQTISVYKSGYDANKVISYLSNRSKIVSVGDTIQLFATYNNNPNKEEWDLGDGRTLTGDTIVFSYPKSGEYDVIYTATYKDTIVKLTCRINCLNKLKLDMDYSVDIKDGFTELTIFNNTEGTKDRQNTNLIGINYNFSFTVLDSNEKQIKYSLKRGGIFSIITTVSNLIDTISKELKLVMPIRNKANINYEYENLYRVYNFSIFRGKIYFLNYTRLVRSYSFQYLRSGDRLDKYSLSLITELLPFNNYLLNKHIIYNDYPYNLEGLNINWNADEAYPNPPIPSPYGTQKLITNNSNFTIENEKGLINIFEESESTAYKFPINQRLRFLSFNKINDNINFLCSNNSNNKFFSYSINTKDSIVSDTVNLTSNYYDDISVYSDTKNKLMLSSVKDLKVFSIDNSYRIIDTLMTEKFNKVYSKSINGNHAFAIIDTSAKDTNQYLKVMDIKNKKSKLVKLDNSVKYHQVYQVNDSITCLMGRKNKDLVIETFKNSLMYFSVFKIEHTGMFTILEKTDDNELHLSFVDTSIPASNLIKTKGFASIFDSVSKSKDTTSHPDDSTSNPIDTTKKDTTKNKGIIYIKDNQFGSVIQDPDFKSAKIYFKDSLDLSNSFVKIYTEAGTEILTYSLNKDHRELPIQTDKLYHGIYYVRLSKDGEEYNLGKFIIVK